MARAQLLWDDAQGNPQRYLLEADMVILGRREDVDLTLPYGFVSGEHARIESRGEEHLLVDLGSTNGTTVNGRGIERHPLRHGDRICLGSGCELRYLIEGQAPEEAPDFLELTRYLTAPEQDASGLEKISHLLDLQLRWEEGFSAESMLREVLRGALDLSGGERAYVLLPQEEGFRFGAGLDASGQPLDEPSFRASRSVARKVAQERAPVFMTTRIDGELAMEQSIMEMHLQAVACLPLLRLDPGRGRDALLGILYLDSTREMHRLSGLDERILGRLAIEAANVLERIEMLEEIERKQALERELALASETQRALLPARLPSLEGHRLRAFCRPTRFVGGDFYDAFPLDDGRLACVLADVSGKGVAASLLSSSIQGALQMLLRGEADAERAAQELNRYLCERSEEGRFVTLFLLLLGADGEGCHMSAGHNPAYLRRAATGQVEELGPGGMILGAFEEAVHRAVPLRLESGDLLLVYSDGLTEAENAEGELFGEHRVLETLHRHGGEGAAALESALLAAVEDFVGETEQADDITLLIVGRDS